MPWSPCCGSAQHEGTLHDSSQRDDARLGLTMASGMMSPCDSGCSQRSTRFSVAAVIRWTAWTVTKRSGHGGRWMPTGTARRLTSKD